MSVSGLTRDEFQEFLSTGGKAIFTLDASEISWNKELENSPLIAGKLTTGFEIPPTSGILEAIGIALVRRYGGDWVYITTEVYRRGGRILYRKLETGEFQAECVIGT